MGRQATHGTATAPAGEFKRLVLPHLDAAYNLARFLSRDPVAADDIVQEAFLRAFRAFDSYRGGDSKSWLLAIVRNCSFSWAKASRVGVGGSAPDPDELADPLQETGFGEPGIAARRLSNSLGRRAACHVELLVVSRHCRQRKLGP